jgi:DNA-binding transcriptional LysR family regulator
MLDHFRLFASVFRHRSITKAARELHLTQPVVSQHLKALQEQFGCLLRKSGRGIEVTERGEALYNDIAPILARIDSVERKYTLQRGSEKFKPVLLGSSHGPATIVLPPVLSAFKRQNPTVDIQFRVSNSPDMQELVVNSEVDVAVITNPAPLASLVMEPFKTFQLCFFVSQDHPLASARDISVEMVAQYPLVIGRAKKARSRVDEVLSSMAANGVKLNVLMRCEWPDAVKSVVREGEAIGILYLDNVEQGVRAGQFKIIDVAGVNLSIISYIVYPKEKALSQNAQEFLRFLRAACQNNALGKVLLRNVQSLMIMLSAIPLGLFDLAVM